MVTKTALIAEINTNYPDNTTGAITPALLRTTTTDEINSWQQAPQVNQQTGTSYTVVVDDYGKMILLANALPVAISLPAATTTGFTPFNVLFKNNGSGTVTITPVTGTIDGAALLALTSGQSAWVVSDGTNWRTGIFTVAGGSGTPGGTSGQIEFNNAGVFGGFTMGGDATLVTSTGVMTIAASAVTYAKMQAAVGTSILLGRGSSGPGTLQEITLGTNLSLSGTTLNAVAGGSGVVAGQASHAVGIGASATALGTNVLLGNNQILVGTAAADPVAATVSGDLTNAGGTFNISANAVTYAKQQNISAASLLIGRGSAAGAGVHQEITLGTNLSMSGTTLNATGGAGLPLVGTGATVTTNQPLLDLSQTWNAGAVTFTGAKLNVTNTASAALSKIVDFQFGGSTFFAVGRAASNLPALWFSSNGVAPTLTNYLVLDNSGNYEFNAPQGIQFAINGAVDYLIITTAAITIHSTTPLFWSNDLSLYRDAANILAQRNAANAQTERIYNTFTDASNYERLTLDWNTTANVCYIRNEAAGTGSARLCIYRSGSTTVSGLPSAATAGSGARCFVTDATVTTFLSTVVGGGTNKVPVVSDGTNWLIG